MTSLQIPTPWGPVLLSRESLAPAVIFLIMGVAITLATIATVIYRLFLGTLFALQLTEYILYPMLLLIAISCFSISLSLTRSSFRASIRVSPATLLLGQFDDLFRIENQQFVSLRRDLQKSCLHEEPVSTEIQAEVDSVCRTIKRAVCTSCREYICSFFKKGLIGKDFEIRVSLYEPVSRDDVYELSCIAWSPPEEEPNTSDEEIGFKIIAPDANEPWKPGIIGTVFCFKQERITGDLTQLSLNPDYLDCFGNPQSHWTKSSIQVALYNRDQELNPFFGVLVIDSNAVNAWDKHNSKIIAEMLDILQVNDPSVRGTKQAYKAILNPYIWYLVQLYQVQLMAYTALDIPTCRFTFSKQEVKSRARERFDRSHFRDLG